jgi:hypothetical protein
MRCFATASSLSVAQLVPMPAAQVKVTTREHGIDTNKMSMFVPEEAMRCVTGWIGTASAGVAFLAQVSLMGS